jgi:prepilin-type N-terminal cleavage/methylation domain-containing protein
MKALGHIARQCRSDDGFTLVETLIALMILAISAGLLVQSVALATSQIKTSALAGDAELLALSLLAESAAKGGNEPSAEGIDQASGLHWRVIQEWLPRAVDEVKQASASFVSIEIRITKGSAPVYQLRSVSMEADAQ